MCDLKTYGNLIRAYGDFQKLSNVSLFDKLDQYNHLEWMLRQSFCFEGQPEVFLFPKITDFGICYTLNLDDSMLNREMFDFKINFEFLTDFQFIEFQKTFCRKR